MFCMRQFTPSHKWSSCSKIGYIFTEGGHTFVDEYFMETSLNTCVMFISRYISWIVSVFIKQTSLINGSRVSSDHTLIFRFESRKCIDYMGVNYLHI